MLQTRAVVFAVEKAGSSLREWEDGAAAEAGDLRYGPNPRFALAVGATEAYDSIHWVERLLDSFMGSAGRAVPPLDHDSMRTWLERAQHDWTTAPRNFANFFEERKFAEGSFATFLGCEIGRMADGRFTWSAVALGDTVLFHVRDGRLVEQFPALRAEDFGITPDGVHTRAEALPLMMDQLQIKTGGAALAPGDRLFLATDALADWIVRALRREGQERVWQLLSRFAHPEGFTRFVADRRAARSMKNDDVTLMRVDVSDSDPAYVVVCH